VKVLVIGGTSFVGRAFVELAASSGHDVTVFHRGEQEPDGLPPVTHAHGDRDGDLDRLGDATFDAVVDTSGYVPRVVDASASLLADRAQRYLFVSTTSVYPDDAEPPVTDDTPVHAPPFPDTEDVTGETYGPLKVACEVAVRERFGGRATIVRPGYIVGPLDPTDRSTYWPVRFKQGGEMAVPGTPKDPIQIVDVRDLVAFMMGLVERRVDGYFNAVTPPNALTMGDLMDTSRKVTGADTKLTWIDEDFLAANLKPEEMNFAPWGPMRGEEAGGSLTGMQASADQGLKARSLEETVRDTLAWHETRPAERKVSLKSGFTPEKEAEILKLWHARKT
jgi:2'-hydroxyisoflavone reductase